jgi:hypothetical protein
VAFKEGWGRQTSKDGGLLAGGAGLVDSLYDLEGEEDSFYLSPFTWPDKLGAGWGMAVT